MSDSTIGVIGLGIMGSAMAGHLMRAGHPVIGYDVRAGRCAASRRPADQWPAAVATSAWGPHRDHLVAVIRRAHAGGRRAGAACARPLADRHRDQHAPDRREGARTLASSREGSCSSIARSAAPARRRARGTSSSTPAARARLTGASLRGARRLRPRALLCGPVWRRLEDEVRGQPARRHSQRRHGRSARARDEGRSRPRARS